MALGPASRPCSVAPSQGPRPTPLAPPPPRSHSVASVSRQPPPPSPSASARPRTPHSPASPSHAGHASIHVSLDNQRGVNLCFNGPTRGTGFRVVRWMPRASTTAAAFSRADHLPHEAAVSPLTLPMPSAVDQLDDAVEWMQELLLSGGMVAARSRPHSQETHDIFTDVSVVRAAPGHGVSQPPTRSHKRSDTGGSAVQTHVQAWPDAVGSASFDANATAQIEDLARQDSADKRKQRHRAFREALTVRLRDTAERQRNAVRQVLEHVEAESIEQHAGHLMNNSRLQKRRESKHSASQPTLSRALSAEQLDIASLPPDRTYTVFPDEKYHFHARHFPAPYTDMEKELRMCYRSGQIDEIRRKQFGKVFLATRKHYMELERTEFLQALWRKQKARKAAEAAARAKRSASVHAQHECVTWGLTVAMLVQGGGGSEAAQRCQAKA
ncbi:hypothetical protein BC831DRAFT_445541, partial [Entophlyctis helioformis]